MSAAVVASRVLEVGATRCRAVPWRLVVACIAVAAAWHDVFFEMWLRWLPAWNQANASWSERWLGGEGYYHHGPWVAVVSGVMAWGVWRTRWEMREKEKWQSHEKSTRWAMRCGVSMIAVGMSTLLLSRVADVTFLGGFALPPVLLGMCLYAGGWRMGRAYLGPISLLMFMVPLPLISIAHLNYELKQFAASGAVTLINLLPGPGVRLDGSFASWAGPQPGGMMIGEACSGLRGIVTMTWIAAVLAARRGLDWPARGTLLAAAIPAALAINLVRVAALLGLGRAVGVKAVAPETTAHDLVGVVCFAIGIAALCGLDVLLRKRAAPSRPLPTFFPTRAKRTSASLPPRPASPRPAPAWPLLSLLCVAIAIAMIQHPQHAAEAPDFNRIPSTVTIAGTTFHGSDLVIPQQLIESLGHPAMLHRRYATPSGAWAFDLQIVQHTRDRRALHPPEVCLRGSGLELTDRRVIDLHPTGHHDLDTLRVTAFTAHREAKPYPVRVVYRSSAGFTTSSLLVHADMLRSRVLGGEARGAVIRIDAADETVANLAAETLLPRIP
ncbi:MAG: exosortase/archaeosortase family protein [Phycisphaeraceae bacterium]